MMHYSLITDVVIIAVAMVILAYYQQRRD